METYFEIIKMGMGDYSLHHLVWHLTIVALCIMVSGIFSIADTVSGIYTAKKVGEKLRSHRFRTGIGCPIRPLWWKPCGRRSRGLWGLCCRCFRGTTCLTSQ